MSYNLLCQAKLIFDVSIRHFLQTELLDHFDLNLHRIEKDVLRCDRNYPYFTHENLDKLRNVISR